MKKIKGGGGGGGFSALREENVKIGQPFGILTVNQSNKK